MPLFPGERFISAADAVREGIGVEIITTELTAQTGRCPEQVNFSLVPVQLAGDTFQYLLARPHTSPGIQNRFESEPDIWWVYDADLDDSRSWLAQAIFTDTGHIAYDETGEALQWMREPWGTTAQRQAQMAAPEDEGDAIGAPPPRPQGGAPQGFVRNIHDLVQTARLPQGNSSVRDALTRMQGLDAGDAVYADDASLNNPMLGTNNFLRLTAATTLQNTGARSPDPESPAEDEPPVPVSPRPRPTVYDHLHRNCEDIRRPRPAPTVWERLAAQRGKK
jgi:hypothetical protein